LALGGTTSTTVGSGRPSGGHRPRVPQRRLHGPKAAASRRASRAGAAGSDRRPGAVGAGPSARPRTGSSPDPVDDSLPAAARILIVP